MSKKPFFLIVLSVYSILFLESCADNRNASIKSLDNIPVHEEALAAIQKSDQYFKKFGQLQRFEWVPSGYQAGFVYDIYYYIPNSIVSTKDSPALVFMHGGGSSTMDRAGSNRVVGSYTKTVIAAAEKYKFIAVLPSANGLNWGSHTQTILTELASLLRSELNFDTNRLGLSGHSMGGMGIGRNYYRIVNDYSFVNAISAGIADTAQTEDRLMKMFNIKYSHQLGIKDHFEDFKVWTKKLEQNVKNLSLKYNISARFESEWFNDAHVYTDAQTKKLESLFKEKREIFQKNLYGFIYFADKKPIENKIQHIFKGTNRYLWLQNIPVTAEDNMNFVLETKNNSIKLGFLKKADGTSGTPISKVFRAYLSSKVFDLNKNISIYVEGLKVAEYKAKSASRRKPGLIVKNDPASKYEDVFEFSF